MYDLRNIWDEEFKTEACHAPNILNSPDRLQRVGVAAMLRAQELARAEFAHTEAARACGALPEQQ